MQYSQVGENTIFFQFRYLWNFLQRKAMDQNAFVVDTKGSVRASMWHKIVNLSIMRSEQHRKMCRVSWFFPRERGKNTVGGKITHIFFEWYQPTGIICRNYFGMYRKPLLSPIHQRKKFRYLCYLYSEIGLFQNIVNMCHKRCSKLTL